MAYINVEEGVPGIRSLALFRPETGKPLYELAQILLRGPSPLTEAERELIAAYVSYRNDCMFCWSSHAAAARCLYGDEKNIQDVLEYLQSNFGISYDNAAVQTAQPITFQYNNTTALSLSQLRGSANTTTSIKVPNLGI